MVARCLTQDQGRGRALPRSDFWASHLFPRDRRRKLHRSDVYEGMVDTGALPRAMTLYSADNSIFFSKKGNVDNTAGGRGDHGEESPPSMELTPWVSLGE